MPNAKSPKPLQSKLLNIGCGRCYHQDWINLDLDPHDPAVMNCDVMKGLPIEAGQLNAVYHSHVLEHLSPEDGLAMIQECFRVLKPGGIMRIVVPDLEQIVRLYLQQHELACQGDELAKANYDWMKLELIDQMVRRNSGGKMGAFITSPMISNPEFVISRLGNEFDLCVAASRTSKANSFNSVRSAAMRNRWETTRIRIKNWLLQARIGLVARLIRVLLGSRFQKAFEEGLFRSQGEIHRWMYDRYSLNQLCKQAGFVEGEAKTAFESQIDNFGRFELDSINGKIRKPDSLFFECIKPNCAVQNNGPSPIAVDQQRAA